MYFASNIKFLRKRRGRTQDDVAFAVRAGQCGISRAEDGNNRRADGGGQVHRAAIVGDHDRASTIDLGKLGEIGLPGEIRTALGEFFDAWRIFGGTGEHDTLAGQSLQEHCEFVVTPQFRLPARRRIDRNEPSRRCDKSINEGNIGGRRFERKFNGPRLTAKMTCGQQITIHSVGARNFNDLIIK